MITLSTMIFIVQSYPITFTTKDKTDTSIFSQTKEGECIMLPPEQLSPAEKLSAYTAELN